VRFKLTSNFALPERSTVTTTQAFCGEDGTVNTRMERALRPGVAVLKFSNNGARTKWILSNTGSVGSFQECW